MDVDVRAPANEAGAPVSPPSPTAEPAAADVALIILGARSAESAALAEQPAHDDADAAMKRLVLRLPAAHRAALDELRQRLWNEARLAFSRADLMRFFVTCGLAAIDPARPVVLQLSMPDLKRARASSPRLRRRRPKRGGPSMRQRMLHEMAARPEEVFTPAKLAPLVGATTRDSVRNTLLVLHAKGRIAKVGPGQYRAMPPMLAAETVTTVLEDEDLARVDALAMERGVPRKEMLDTIVASGVAACEGDGAPATQRRPKTNPDAAPIS
jgi:hypothetical protein